MSGYPFLEHKAGEVFLRALAERLCLLGRINAAKVIVESPLHCGRLACPLLSIEQAKPGTMIARDMLNEKIVFAGFQGCFIHGNND